MSTDPRTEPPSSAPWLNRGTDPVSRRVYALIFNGLTGALREFMSLSERERVSSAIYDALRTGGVEVRLEDGLAKLRAVSVEIERQHPASPSSSPVDAPARPTGTPGPPDTCATKETT